MSELLDQEGVEASIPVEWFVCTMCGFGRKAKEGERHAVCDQCKRYRMLPRLDESALLEALRLSEQRNREAQGERDALQVELAAADERLGRIDDWAEENRLEVPGLDDRSSFFAALADTEAGS